MVAKIAVSAATFAIDKPYSYWVPVGPALSPGMRVMVPFGRGNRHCEGMVLSLEEGSPEGLKPVAQVLDPEPVLDDTMLRLAGFLRERYFCTLYDAVRAMLPAGMGFRALERFSLTEDLSWKTATIRKAGAKAVLEHLQSLGGQADASHLRQLVPGEDAFREVMSYLVRKGWVHTQMDLRRRTADKAEQVAVLCSSVEEAMDYAAGRPKSAAMQRAVLEL